MTEPHARRRQASEVPARASAGFRPGFAGTPRNGHTPGMDGRRCAICGQDCEELEPGFRRPDAVFAVPAEERAGRVRESDDLVSIDEQVFFIRCVAPVPVIGREEPFAWGFWVRVSREHFEEYRRFFDVDPPRDHPGFQGTIANQTRLLPPTLGLPVHVHLGRGRHRPRLMLLDERHELTQQQNRGITAAAAHGWSDRCGEDVVDPPDDAPSTPRLDREGWRVGDPAELGLRASPPAAPPRLGDEVKAPFVFLAANARGDATERTELMWVQLDEVREDGWWSGTLDDHPYVPGPIDRGSRVWLRPEQALEHVRADPPAPRVAARSSLRERVRRWLRGWGDG